MELLKKGAEANIYLTTFLGQKVVVKRRIRKEYRIKEVDFKIRDYRTVHESQLLHQAKKTGIPTPTIRFINRSNCEIVMDYIEGIRLKDKLNLESLKRVETLCFKLGEYVGKLHKHGVIHGDLTTSNIIMDLNGKMFFVDFGLGFYSNTVEAQGVDLHLLKQVFESFHYKISKECFNSLMKGYEKIVGKHKTFEILNKIREIEGRGRYVPPESRHFGKNKAG